MDPLRTDRRQCLRQLGRTIVLAATGSAAPLLRADDFWALARQGGWVMLMRHERTEAGIGDPPGFRLGDCRTQRNLSAEGRAGATALGQRLRQAQVPLAAVFSSAWCRCTDTARLAFDIQHPHYPRHQVWPALNSFFQGQGDGSAQTQAVLQRVQAVRAPDNWMLVTHQVNITALTGSFAAMGEVLLTRWQAKQPDRLQVVARWQP